MITPIELSSRSLTLLNRRSLSSEQVADFSQLLNQAKQQTEQQQLSAKQILQQMSPAQLALLQKAHSLADPINVSELSAEGAQNLLAQPDYSNSVDVNNDGIVEVGVARTMIFPPVNAPQKIKDAWDEATAGLDEMDKAMLQMQMHIAVYGIHLEGISDPNRQQLPPNQQWKADNVDKLFDKLRGNLEFEVNLAGWTEHNLMLKDFYDKFESALGQSNNGRATPSYLLPRASSQATNDAKPASTESHRTMDVLNLILDARLGVDREKLKAIEAQIKTVENNDSLSNEAKQQQLQQLAKEKQQLLRETQQRMVDNEKSKSQRHFVMN